MRSIMAFSVFLLLVCLSFPLSSQVHLAGYLQSSVYTFETPTVGQGEFFQGLRARLTPTGYSNAHVNTYLRVAKRGDARWEERIYNLYANWHTTDNMLRLRLGRQFVYEGVVNGTLDGLLLSVRPARNLTIKGFGGVSAPLDRAFEVSDTDNRALGGFLSYRFPWDFKIDLSYFQRQRGGDTNWHLVGGALTGDLDNKLYYLARVDHNLETEQLQGMRYRLTYYWRNWSIAGEYNRQEPRIFEDSYFRIFNIRAYNQIRGELTYQLNQYQLGLRYLFTAVEFDETNQIILSGANRWGYLGFLFQSGFGGDNVGVFGDIRYPIMPALSLKLHASYYNFERQTTVISEDATAFSAGFDYRPWDIVSLQAEVQQGVNSLYDNDWRGLFRLLYLFGGE